MKSCRRVTQITGAKFRRQTSRSRRLVPCRFSNSGLSSSLSFRLPSSSSSFSYDSTIRSFVTRTKPLCDNQSNKPVAASAVEDGVDDEQNAVLAEYLEKEHSIEQELHEDMLKALKSVYGKKLSVSHLKSFGAAGLTALADSVRNEILKKQQRIQGGKNKKIRKRRSRIVHVDIPHHRTSFDLKWREGDSLLDLANDNDELLGEYMEGTCGGQMSCCTCHVYIEDPDLFARLPPPEDAELDMIDLAYEPKSKKSRLGCQVRLMGDVLLPPDDHSIDTDADSKITITIPGGVNDVWN